VTRSLTLLTLTHNYPRFPGDFSGTFIAALCHALADLGSRVIVLTPDDAAMTTLSSDELPNKGNDLRAAMPHSSSTIHHSSLRHSSLSVQPYRYLWPRRAQRFGYMRSTESDLGLTTSARLQSPLVFLFGLLATWRAVRRFHPDVIHAHWVLPNGVIGAVVSRWTGVPLVVSLPGSDVFLAASNPVFGRLARFACHQARLLTTNSDDLRQAAIELGADPARFDLIIYGVDADALRPSPAGVSDLRPRLGLPPDAPVILAVGRLVPKKGFHVLLAGMAILRQQHPAAHLVIVGNGDERARLLAQTERLCLTDRVHFVGNVPYNELPVYYNLADLFVMPSVRQPVDGLNVAVVEAMACGKAIVATTLAGNPLVVREGDNGRLVPPDDPAALAAALGDLLDDPEARAHMGRRSRERAEMEFSWPRLAARYQEHFRRLAQPL